MAREHRVPGPTAVSTSVTYNRQVPEELLLEHGADTASGDLGAVRSAALSGPGRAQGPPERLPPLSLIQPPQGSPGVVLPAAPQSAWSGSGGPSSTEKHLS